MEPVTHVLASVALARAGVQKAARLAWPMLLATGLVADFDWFSIFGGASFYLRAHRTASHSLVGTAAIALAFAAFFWWLGRKYLAASIRFGRALLVCGIGAGVHLLMDLTNSYGVQLLWPFSQKWYAGDLLDSIDVWVLVLLVGGLLLPGLFRLISEEIGARPKPHGPQRGAIVALALLLLYCGGRWALHERALATLRSRLYHDQTPLAVGAFPQAVSFLSWHGVVETDNTLEEIEVSVAPGSIFDPDLALPHYKPEPSPALEAARNTEVAREFLKFARFPHARVVKTPGGYHAELRDLRYSSQLPGRHGPMAVIDLDFRAQVLHEELRLGMARGR